MLAYGTLAGGLLTEKWLGRPEPPADALNQWSAMKYKRFVDAIGGWDVFQEILRADLRSGRSGITCPWPMSRPDGCWISRRSAAVIVGARLGEREHRGDNLAMFSFSLDEADRAHIDEALAATTAHSRRLRQRVPAAALSDRDRRPQPASRRPAKAFTATPVPDRPNRLRIDTGSVWEPICGYSRAMRIGDRILVSGTTATHGSGAVVCKGDVRGQAVYILDKIEASIEALGGALEDVVRTRIYVRDERQWEPVARVHGRYLGHVRPANTLVEVSNLVGGYEVEIEAEAIVG